MPSKFSRNYLPELLAMMFGRRRPAIVTVNLTNKCNQRCIYCELGQGLLSSRQGILGKEDLFWIIDEMASAGIRRLSLCGGEPLLFHSFFEVVAYAGTKKIRCTITSNGMTGSRLGAQELELLIQCNCDFNISIDSMDEATMAFIRGADNALPNAWQSVRTLQNAGIPVTVLVVVSRHNYKELLPLLVKACESGIRQVLFQPVITFSNYPDRPVIEGKASLNVPYEEADALMGIFQEILRYEQKHPISTNIYRLMPWIRAYLESSSRNDGKMFFADILGKFYCRDLDAMIDISYDGGIQPCALTLASVSILGDRRPGLLGLWFKATAGLRNDLQHGHYPAYCNGCCNHFSRNMLASMMKYPLSNHRAVERMIVPVISRIFWRSFKLIKYA